jgi:hypothetical protein
MFVQRSFDDEFKGVLSIPDPARSMSGFVVFPMLLATSGMTWEIAQQIYQIAYERARAALRPSIYERTQFISRN